MGVLLSRETPLVGFLTFLSEMQMQFLKPLQPFCNHEDIKQKKRQITEFDDSMEILYQSWTGHLQPFHYKIKTPVFGSAIAVRFYYMRPDALLTYVLCI